MEMKRLPILLTSLLIITAFGCTTKVVNKDNVTTTEESKPKAVIASETAREKPLSGFLPQEKRNSEQPPINFHAYEYYTSAMILNQLGDYQSAVKMLTKALQYYPNSYEIRYALGEDMFQLKRYRDVLMVLEVAKPKTIQSYLLQVHSYISLNKIDSAMMLFGKMIELDPDSETPYRYLANIYKQTGNIDSLKWAYENLTRIIPIDAESWRELGRIQAQQGDLDKAKESFENSVLADPSRFNILSYVSLSELAMIKDQPDSSIAYLEEAYRVDPDNQIVNRELALTYLRMDSLRAALPYSENLVRLNPNDKPSQRRLGAIFYGLDSLNKCEEIFTALVNSGDKNSLNHYYLGRVAARRDDYNIAVEEFTFLTQMADTVFESWLDLGFAYRQLDQFDKESETYKTGLNHMKTEENALQLMFALAASYERRDMVEEAVETFEAILARSPEYDQALNYLGYMLADRNERLDYALELIEKAININPNNPAYLDSYGWVLYRLGEIDKALVQLNKAANLAEDTTIYDHLGDAYKADGDLKQAQIWWKKALELSPDDEQIKLKIEE